MLPSSLSRIKKYPVVYFLFKLFLFAVLIFVLDFGIGSLLRHYYFTQKSGLQYLTTYSMEQTEARLLVFGSSRANHHYIPDTLERYFHSTCYNVGRNGASIFYHLAILKSVLKRYTPDYIILDFTRIELEERASSYERLSTLLPYYHDHPEIRSIIELRSKYERIKLLSEIYPYNSNFFTIIAGNMKFNKKRKEDFKGYVPLKTTMDSLSKGWLKEEKEAGLDSFKINAYREFILLCKKSNIKLTVVCSPYIFKAEGSGISLHTGQKIAKENGIEFLNYSEDPRFINKYSLFTDRNHLNYKGAEIYSQIIGKQLSKE
ncbi:MAG: hypothetical protein HS118_03160 [Bacteroidia bacterium]|nr:hypothetical protein [Bacteroidia bacterium]